MAMKWVFCVKTDPEVWKRKHRPHHIWWGKYNTGFLLILWCSACFARTQHTFSQNMMHFKALLLLTTKVKKYYSLIIRKNGKNMIPVFIWARWGLFRLNCLFNSQFIFTLIKTLYFFPHCFAVCELNDRW